MRRDVKLLLLSIALLVVGTVALQVTMALQSVAGPAHTIDNTRYHGLAIASVVLLFLGATGIFAASVALSGRLSGSQSLLAGGAFLAFAGMVWWISKEFELASYSWMAVTLLPWCVAVLSGALLIVVGIARLAVSKFRSQDS
jgi:hypothetical protein